MLLYILLFIVVAVVFGLGWVVDVLWWVALALFLIWLVLLLWRAIRKK